MNTTPLQNLSPCLPSRKIPAVQFTSASEVTEYLKKRTTASYYNNNTASQKQAFSSTFTTYLGGVTYKIPSVESTCCTNTQGFVQRPEKPTQAYLMNKWNPT